MTLDLDRGYGIGKKSGKTYTLPLVVVGYGRRERLFAEEDLDVRVGEAGVKLVRAPLVEAPVRHLAHRAPFRHLNHDLTPRQAIGLDDLH